MRIIKLSPNDIDFPNRSSVDKYFKHTLVNRNPKGQFLLTKGRIAEDGIEAGEPIIFPYKTKITHVAIADSSRILLKKGQSYPYHSYFIINVNTICLAQGKLSDLERALSKLGFKKNIVQSQGWPKIPQSIQVEKIWNDLKVT